MRCSWAAFSHAPRGAVTDVPLVGTSSTYSQCSWCCWLPREGPGKQQGLKSPPLGKSSPWPQSLGSMSLGLVDPFLRTRARDIQQRKAALPKIALLYCL